MTLLVITEMIANNKWKDSRSQEFSAQRADERSIEVVMVRLSAPNPSLSRKQCSKSGRSVMHINETKAERFVSELF